MAFTVEEEIFVPNNILKNFFKNRLISDNNQ